MNKDWDEKALYGPPPKIGGLYKVLDNTDCQFIAPTWPNVSIEHRPVNVGDVIMVVSWSVVEPERDDDVSTWGKWIAIQVLNNEKVTHFEFHRLDWNHHFARVK